MTTRRHLFHHGLFAAALGCGASTHEPSNEPPAQGASTPPAATEIPRGPTPATQLAPPGYFHQLVLEIGQDFHPDDAYEIALDGWVQLDQPEILSEVRMWWADTSKDKLRSPFGKGVRRHIDLDYRRESPNSWLVSIAQGRTAYDFTVELSGGAIAAFATVTTTSGEVVDRCQATSGRLIAKKLLGLPVGFKGLDVACVDARGTPRTGRLVARER